MRDPVTGKKSGAPTSQIILKQASRWYFGFERKTRTVVSEEFKDEIAKVRYPTPNSSSVLWLTSPFSQWVIEVLERKEGMTQSTRRIKKLWSWQNLGLSISSSGAQDR